MYYLSSLIFLNSVFSELKVQTAKGILKGQTLKSRDGKLYYSFTGIPYAKPPIGKLRFEVGTQQEFFFSKSRIYYL